MQHCSHELFCKDYFEETSHNWIQYLDQSHVGQLSQTRFFWGSNLHTIWAKIMQPSVL